MNLIVKLIAVFAFVLIINVDANCQNTAIKSDTINRTDAGNLKQGWWVTLDANGQQVVEKGQYKNGKKEGIWTGFYPSGTTKHEITFKGGLANGPANFYYETGQLWETGTWMIDHWVGSYNFFYPSGQKQYEWNYNNLGKRQGVQNYYHTNGKLKYTGTWTNGKTSGKLLVYNEQGKLTEERIYTDGKFEKSVDNPTPIDDVNAPSNQSISQFTGTGNHTVYNLSGKIEKMGYFKNGVLIDGEQFIYNSEGILTSKLIYEKGVLKQTIDLTTTK